MARMNDRFMIYFVPKTAGTWARAAIKRSGIGGLARTPTLAGVRPFGLRAHHSTPEAVPSEYKHRFQFCFVRRPYEWYQSFWAFRAKEIALEENYMPHGGLVLDYLWDANFRQFLSNVLSSCPGILTLMFQRFVGPNNDWMDFVGHQETAAKDLLTALKMAGYTDLNDARIRRLKPMNVTEDEYKKQARAPGHVIAGIEKTERWILDTFYD